jgi:hypothetical protein
MFRGSRVLNINAGWFVTVSRARRTQAWLVRQPAVVKQFGNQR